LNPDPDPDMNPHLDVDSIQISPVWRTPVYTWSRFVSGYWSGSAVPCKQCFRY